MRVGMNPAQGQNASFSAINLSHFDSAARDYKYTGDISPRWYNQFSDEVFFYNLSKRDARDTLTAVKKYVNPESLEHFNRYVKTIRDYFINP